MSPELKLHTAICQAVSVLNVAPEVARISEGREVSTILRQALADYAENFMDHPVTEKERSAVASGHQTPATPTRTEFEAAALPPLPEPAYWETMGRVYKDKTEAERVAWLTSETAGKSRPVYGVYTAGQMHEFRRAAIAAHAAQTERERFEAAAYRWLRMRCADEQEDLDEPQLIHLHSNNRMPAGMNWQTHLDTAIAAAMGWPSVLENGG